MDIATIISIVVSFGLMVWAILLGDPLSIFVDIPSVAIVFGGSIGVIAIVRKTVLIKESDTNKLIAQLLDFAGKARKGGILSLNWDFAVARAAAATNFYHRANSFFWTACPPPFTANRGRLPPTPCRKT